MQKRMMLQAAIFEGNRTNLEPQSDRFLALNEMCVKPASADRMPSCILEMEVDGEVVDQYQGDGLIVATPTGSTCYTASANGPIIHSGMDAIAVTPICPLSLSSRAIVLAARFSRQHLAFSRLRTQYQTLDRRHFRYCNLARTARRRADGRLRSQVYHFAGKLFLLQHFEGKTSLGRSQNSLQQQSPQLIRIIQ